MFDPLSRQRSKPSLFAFIGGVLAAAAIALSAYAAHGVADAHLQGNLQNAALYAFGHGLALATDIDGILNMARPARASPPGDVAGGKIVSG